MTWLLKRQRSRSGSGAGENDGSPRVQPPAAKAATAAEEEDEAEAADEVLLRTGEEHHINKLVLQLEFRAGELEAITQDTVVADRDHAVIKATKEAGKEYSNAIKGKSQGEHGKGPPHLHAASATCSCCCRGVAWVVSISHGMAAVGEPPGL